MFHQQSPFSRISGDVFKKYKTQVGFFFFFPPYPVEITCQEIGTACSCFYSPTPPASCFEFSKAQRWRLSRSRARSNLTVLPLKKKRHLAEGTNVATAPTRVLDVPPLFDKRSLAELNSKQKKKKKKRAHAQQASRGGACTEPAVCAAEWTQGQSSVQLLGPARPPRAALQVIHRRNTTYHF